MKTLLLSLLIITLSRFSDAITYEYMDYDCGTTIDLSVYDSVRLKLTSRSSYLANMNCQLKIKTDYSSRIMLYFKSFSVYSNDYLELRDGSSSTSPYVTGLYGHQNGYYMSSSIYKTTTNYLYLNFQSGNYRSGNTGFDMIITSYHTGICYSYEYSCSNGRCIDDSLTCNGYNPCGDYSDCDGVVVTVGGIAGIVVGAIFFVIIVTIVSIVICRRRRFAYVGRTAQPVNVVTTATVASAGYNQPMPAQYPAPSYPVGQQYPTQQPYQG